MDDGIKKYVKLFANVEMGVGSWQWGDRLYWGYQQGNLEQDALDVFNMANSTGVNFFDTAESYGQGRSERLLGKFIASSGKAVKVATKFMPYPWRLSRKDLHKALRESLIRLGINKVSLYQIHHPLPPIKVEIWMQALAEVVELGLADAVGISNFNRALTDKSQEALAKEGIRLASNQVEYNLLDRKVEKEGLLSYCQSSGIKLIAYSPLAQGILSGKYSPQNPPKGVRSYKYGAKLLHDIQPLISLMKKIGSEHGGKSPSQVALNWVICKGALPIPGAKNYQQAAENLGALEWRLSEQEIQFLDDASNRFN